MKALFLVDSQLSDILGLAKTLAEFVRRSAPLEIDIVDLGRQQSHVISRYDFLVVIGGIWRGGVTTNLVKAITLQSESISSISCAIVLGTHLSSKEFKRAVSKSLPLDVLQNAVTYNIGRKFEYAHLNPIDKLWWNISRQKMSNPYSEDKVAGLAKELIVAVSRLKEPSN